MFIRIKSTPNSPRKSVQIVASVRDGNKVRQKIMRHVGVAQNDAELAQLKGLAEFIKTQMEEEQKWPPKIGQRDKCLLGSSRHLGSRFVVDAVRRAPVKRLVPSLGIVEGEIPAQ